MGEVKVQRLQCDFCKDRFTLGEGIQKVSFPTGNSFIVHMWRCKESLYPVH